MKMKLSHISFLLLTFISIENKSNAFVVTTKTAITTAKSIRTPTLNNINPLTIHSQSNDFNEKDNEDESWNSPEDYENSSSSSTSSSSSISSKRSPSLGINIELEPLTPQQAESLKSEATKKINEAFDGRLKEIEKMKQTIQSDFEQSKKTLRYASDLRAQEETEKLMNKIDRISSGFLEKNEELRTGTKLAAKADRINAREGKGLEVGSWGSIGGMNVGMGVGMELRGGSGLLGSVGSLGQFGAVTEQNEEEGMVSQDIENRIMVICDDKQVRTSNTKGRSFAQLTATLSLFALFLTCSYVCIENNCRTKMSKK